MLLFLLTITNEKDHEKIMFIYENYHDDMLRFAKMKLKNIVHPHFDEEDVVQESFVKIVKSLDCVDLGRTEAELRTYFRAVVKNKILDLLKKTKPCENLDEYEEQVCEDDFVEMLFAKETYEEIARAVDALPEIYKITFMYRFYEKMSLQDIADFMDVPLSTVKTRIVRGRRLLQENLDKGKYE